MAAYIVSYDLNKKGQNYDCIHKKIKSYRSYRHIQNSVWIIITDDSATDIGNHLADCLDSNDQLFVAALEGEAAWHGYSQNTTDWLNTKLP